MSTDEKVLQGKRAPFSPLAWQSRKLPRFCRSSTAAEIQTGSHSMDAHEFTKQTLVQWFNEEPLCAKSSDQALKQVPSIAVTDSKNLYDSVVRVEMSGLQLEERRLALEVLSIRERSAAIGVKFRWVDADQQLADGLSKPFMYNGLLMVFPKGLIGIEFDGNFTSAKKKRAWQRKQGTKNETCSQAESGSIREEIFSSVELKPSD